MQLSSRIAEFSRHIAGSAQVTAIALVNTHQAEKLSEKATLEVLVVINNFQPRLMSYFKTVNQQTIFFYAIDQRIFELDIDRGFLGESIAGRLIFPHTVIAGNDYLREKEVLLKKRLILEALQNLAYSFPELAAQLQILPQYFLYEALSDRIRVFPLLAYDVYNLTNCLVQNESQELSSYVQALKQLETEGKISYSDGFVRFSADFLGQCQNPKTRFLNVAKNAPRTLFSSLFGVLPQLMNVVSQNAEAFMKTLKVNWKLSEATSAFVDPQKFVFFPTTHGLVSLADRMNILEFARKFLPEQNMDVQIKRLGGMLNDVYLIRAYGKGTDAKILAKRFKDWSGFKWFPLTLWSFGARSFAVSAQARLAKECAISGYLKSQGFNVPKVLHVSNVERLIFMEFIDGESLSDSIKKIAIEKMEDIHPELERIRRTGEILGQVHACNVSLGDTKPDNMLVKEDGAIYLIDFEQALQGGDKAWDVAVFLYYSGHYLAPDYSNLKAEAITKAFIEGYLKGGGKIDDVRQAGTSKYTRVFSIFTMPNTIRSISSVCKTAQPCKG